jgi:2-polyprenyl-3-methyl-5-hydroxy-6-metoxy-1,4-benzoquinol methylase
MSYRCSHSSDGYGELYSKTYQEGYYYYQWNLIEKPLLEKIFNEIENKDNLEYLDFACGTGRILSIAEKSFKRTCGIDVSETMLKQAKDTCKKSKLLNIDITKETIANKFDVITAFRFFLNAEKKLRHDVLETFSKILNENGLLIINIHVNSKSLMGFFYKMRNMLFKVIKNESLAKICSFEEMNDLLREQGFTIKKVYWYSFLPRTGWYLGWVPKYFMLSVEKYCQKSIFIPKSMAQSFLIVAQKRPI